MRLFRHLMLCGCLLLAGSSLVGTRHLLVARTVEGCGVWLGSWPDGYYVTWSGECSGQSRLADGVGRLELLSGSAELIVRFDGEIRQGRRSPHGRQFWPDPRELISNRSRFNGNFDSGTEIFDGVRYVGGFKADVRSGVGYMFWPNGDAHRGGWKSGLPNGYGETRMGDEVIAGQWRDGCLLNSARTVAVAVPLRACVGLAAGRNPPTTEPDVTMRRVRSVFAAPSGGGCVPVEPGSGLRLCR